MVQGFARLGKKLIFLTLLLFIFLIGDDQELHLDSIGFNKSINSIHQDSFGFLWFGTDNGLYRYDGERYQTYKLNPYEINSLSDDNILDIQENSHKKLFIGTQSGGLNIFDQISEQIFHFETEQLCEAKITALLASDNYSWFGTENDLYLLETEFDSLIASSVNINNKITDIRRVDDNNIIATTVNDGFYIISHNYDKEWKFQKEHYLGNVSVNFAYPVLDNVYLIATDRGFYIYNYSTKKIESLNQEQFSEKIYSLDKNAITKDENGNIWMGSGYKLYQVSSIESITDVKIESYDLEMDNRFSRGINLLYYDRSGVLWINLKGKGLYKYYPKRNFDHCNINQGLMSNIIFSVLEHNNHSVLLGTHHGLFIYDFDNFTAQRLPNTEPLNYQVITSLYKDKNMNLWCGTNEGLFKLTSDQKLVQYKQQSNELSSISSNFITSITGCNDKDGDIWVGTRDGLNRYRVKYDNFVHYYADENSGNSLAGNEIECIYLSHDNNLWIGTNGDGVSLLKDEEIEKFEPKFVNYINQRDDLNTISNDNISFITEDCENRLWIGTFNGGLNLLDSLGNFKHIMEVNGLIENEILSIIPTANNKLWISTSIGLAKYDINGKIFKNYYFKDGIKDGDYLEKSACIMSDGKIIFGSKSGFTYFHPDKIRNNMKPAQPQVAAFFIYNEDFDPVKQNNQSILNTKYIELGYDENVISMYICGLHYVNPVENTLSYYMEGVDSDWHQCKNNNYITYSNLKPDTYTFHLKAANNDNIWNKEERILKIKVTAPFYATIWFKAFILLVIASLIYGFIRYRLSKVTKRKITLEKQIWEKNKKNEELNRALMEVEKLKNQLQNENTFLKSEITTSNKHKNIVTDSKKMKNILHQVEIASGADPTILILGESGTGKDLLANAIHQTSGRKNESFIKVDCAALPPNLIESELFGHEKGAFTGANKRKLGRFELANGGTIFLDEIGELPIKVQQKLLRVLQSGEFERLGNSMTLKTNTRIIAATNRNLEEEVKNGQFREDLFYRLNVFPIYLPPLRDRIEDIPLLVQHFVSKYSDKFNKAIDKIPQNAISKLMAYSWPGNIRELENIIQRSIIVSPENVLELGDWFVSDAKKDLEYEDNLFLSLDELQKRHIEKILEFTNGKVSGENGAAEILKINAKTLFSRMKKLNINN